MAKTGQNDGKKLTTSDRRCSDTLCIYCLNACTSGCSWAANGEPVKGWTATPFYDKDNGKLTSYMIHDCPKFRKDRGERKSSDYSNSGAVRLVSAIFKAAKEDYVKSPRLRGDIAKWIMSDEFANLSMGIDQKTVLEQLKTEARMADSVLISKG